VGDELEIYYKKSESANPVVVLEVLDENIKVKYVNYN
jgi:hypothetical protein